MTLDERIAKLEAEIRDLKTIRDSPEPPEGSIWSAGGEANAYRVPGDNDIDRWMLFKAYGDTQYVTWNSLILEYPHGTLYRPA